MVGNRIPGRREPTLRLSAFTEPVSRSEVLMKTEPETLSPTHCHHNIRRPGKWQRTEILDQGAACRQGLGRLLRFRMRPPYVSHADGSSLAMSDAA